MQQGTEFPASTSLPIIVHEQSVDRSRHQALAENFLLSQITLEAVTVSHVLIRGYGCFDIVFDILVSRVL